MKTRDGIYMNNHNLCNHKAIKADFNIWKPTHCQLYLNERLRYGSLVNLVLSKKIRKLIDIGCGTGYMSYLLSRKGLKITAVDISKTSLLAFKKIAKANNINQVHSDLFDLQCAGFDAVLSQEVLEHIENYEQALVKMASFIKPNGYAFYCVPYKENLTVKMVECPICGQKYNRNGHLHSFSKELFCDCIEKAGFKIIKIRLIVNKRITKWFKASKLMINYAFPLLEFLDRIMNFIAPHKAAYIAVLCIKN